MECDIEKLIAAIHVAPLAAPYYADAVRQVVGRLARVWQFPCSDPSLLAAPDY